MSDYVTLMVCCNDHRNGMFTGRIDALDLCWPGGLMAISLYLAVVDAPARVAFGQGFIKISRRRFASRGYGEMVRSVEVGRGVHGGDVEGGGVR